MSNKKTPVFPNPLNPYDVPGMTLRDYFAAQALQSILAKGKNEQGLSQADCLSKAAEWAYFTADRMLEARDNPNIH